MKQSYYNVLATLHDGAALYNTRTRSIVELDSDEVHALQNIETYQDEPLIKQLANMGFVMENPEAEADLMLYRQHQYRNNKRVFELTITLTRECNFDCDYCYVPKRPGIMSTSTMDSVFSFVKYHFDQTPFEKLKVNWYGGEPLLAIDAMEYLSGLFIGFCRENNVRYVGHILSNASLASKEMCSRLVENCGIVSVMPTLSGDGDMHDWQRPAKNGRKYFDTIMQNIDNMIEAGIIVHINYVTNANNIEECTDLVKRLCHKKGVRTRLSKTGPFGKDAIFLRDGKNTPLRLMTPEEFGPCYVSFHRARELDATGYEEILKPIPLYCAALVNRSFFIDEQGDVTTCMVDMDYPDRTLFNVNEYVKGSKSIKMGRFLQYANLEPIRSGECRTCRILPLCQGGCYEKYLATGTLACHIIKPCIEDIVRDYYHALEKEQAAEEQK